MEAAYRRRVMERDLAEGKGVMRSVRIVVGGVIPDKSI